jgi:hypothetical protein
MPKYVIERDVPGAGQLSNDEVTGIAQKSNGVLADMGDVQWMHSYITGDKVFCVYIAPNEDRVREHASRGDFPITAVREVMRETDPTTGGA